MEPGGQTQQQRAPFNQQRRSQSQWQVVGQANQVQGAGRPRQGQLNQPANPGQPQAQPPNQPHNQHQSQGQHQTHQGQHPNQTQNQNPTQQRQRADRRQFSGRAIRRQLDVRERSGRFGGGQVSQPGSSQSSDSEAVDRQHGAREAESGSGAGGVPAVKEPTKFEPVPNAEPSLSAEQKLQEKMRQRDELNRAIEQLRAELADRAEVNRLQKQLEQLQGQLADEQKLRKDLEGAYEELRDAQGKLEAAAHDAEAALAGLRGQVRERDAHIAQLGEQLSLKEQQLRDSQEQSDEAAWRNDSALRDQENQIRLLRKEKEEAIAEGNARHQMIERQTSSIAGLERQLQENVQKLEKKDEQLQAAQEAAWAKEEQLREAEAGWKVQMEQVQAYHVRNGQLLQDAAGRAWHEKQLADHQFKEFKQYHDKVVRQLQEELAARPPPAAAKPEPLHKGLPNGGPPPGSVAPGAGVRGPAEATAAPPILPPGVPPSILPSAQTQQTPPLPQASRTIQPIHPASKPQASQQVQPPNLQTDSPPQGQHQQGLLRRAVEPSVTANPPPNPPPAQFPRQPEPYRPLDAAKPAQENPLVSAQAQNAQAKPAGSEPRGKLLDTETLLVCLSEIVPGRAEEAILINTVLANKLAPKIAPHPWRTYRKEHGTLREFLAAHPESFCITTDDKVYLTPEAQQKRATPLSSASPAQPATSGSPTPQEASKAAARNAPGGSPSEPAAKGGSPPQVAVTPIAVNAAAQKQKQRQQPQNGARTDSGGSDGRPSEPPAAANGKALGPKSNVSNRGNGSVGGSRNGGPQGSNRQNSFSSNGGNVSGGQNASGGLGRNGPKAESQNGPRQGSLHGNGPSANDAGVNEGSGNGGSVHGQASTANGGSARSAATSRQIPSKSPSNTQPSKPLYVPKGSTAPPKESESAKV